MIWPRHNSSRIRSPTVRSSSRHRACPRWVVSSLWCRCLSLSNRLPSHSSNSSLSKCLSSSNSHLSKCLSLSNNSRCHSNNSRCHSNNSKWLSPSSKCHSSRCSANKRPHRSAPSPTKIASNTMSKDSKANRETSSTPTG